MKTVADDPFMEQYRSTLTKATGAALPHVQDQIVRQVTGALWLPKELGEEQIITRISAAIAMLEGIKPQDGIEGMLAVHMVATHSAAMECLRRAMSPDQSFEGRDANLRHGERLMAIYARQLEVLDKHRGKGQQQVTVKYVNVEAGGQAVVGNVQSSPQSQPSRNQEPPALTDQSAMGMEIDTKLAPVKEPAKRRA